jgi:16S rRNA (uracil1498-N3)-methyltransferase
VPRVPEAGGAVTLDADGGHHLVRAARRRVGDATEVIDPEGRIWPAVIEDVGPPVRLRVGDRPRSGPATLPLDLFVGTLEWGRFDLLVEKCTEIGVARVTLFASARAARKVSQDGFDRRRDRLERLVDAAAKQSGQGRRPALCGLVPFSTVIDDISHGTGFLVDARGEQALGTVLRAAAPTRVALVVGSEAGFSDGEIAQARAGGLTICSLGAATLRAETAALVAVAIASDAVGTSGAI